MVGNSLLLFLLVLGMAHPGWLPQLPLFRTSNSSRRTCVHWSTAQKNKCGCDVF